MGYLSGVCPNNDNDDSTDKAMERKYHKHGWMEERGKERSDCFLFILRGFDGIGNVNEMANVIFVNSIRGL